MLPIRQFVSVKSVCGLRRYTSTQNLDFSDHKTVFRYKPTKDLLRSLTVLNICSVNQFVDNALPAMRLGERVLGKTLFSRVARATFYTQFVGGDTQEELRATYESLRKAGIRLMVCPALEEDQGEEGTEEKYQENMKYISQIGKIMVAVGEKNPCLQFKVTAMIPADLLVTISNHLGNTTSLDELAIAIGKSLERGKRLELDFLSVEENEKLNKGISVLARFGQEMETEGLRLLVDAEYTYMNPGISAMALGMMMAFNKRRPVVWNTYQCYLKHALKNISAELTIVQKAGCCFGAKLVRGAYMEKERKMAEMGGYMDPVNDTYEDTGAMFNRVCDYMLEHIRTVGDRCNIVLGTHNEKAALHAAAKIRETGIDPKSGQVVFGQIYGMADQISVPLSEAGFVVYKSVPYGPLGEVLPYLSRRAAENRVVLAGARREKELLKKELARRFMQKLQIK